MTLVKMEPTEIIFEKKTNPRFGIFSKRTIHSGAQVRAELIPMGEINIRAEMEDEGKNITQRKHKLKIGLRISIIADFYSSSNWIN